MLSVFKRGIYVAIATAATAVLAHEVMHNLKPTPKPITYRYAANNLYAAINNNDGNSVSGLLRKYPIVATHAMALAYT